MTIDTKSTSEATSNESTTYEGSSDFLNTYARLRTVLDSLEITALRYCLMNDSSAEKIERAKEIEVLLMPVIRKLSREAPPICPDGFFNCRGCCLPYPCVEQDF